MDQKIILILLGGLLSGCGASPEKGLRQQFATQATGVIQLPAGEIEISEELVLAPGAHDLEIAGTGTTLKVSSRFKGRAAIVADGARNLRVHDLSIAGPGPGAAVEMVPPENALRVWYSKNGILADRVEGLTIEDVNFTQIASFPILVSRSSKIRISKVRIEDSGSKNAKQRNNLTGGILIEEGSKDFEVRDSTFRRILGNALWTHSLQTSPRLEQGVFEGNRFETIGRDAIQVGHATRVRVESNKGQRIGYPQEIVDVENGGTPVAIDTAGNVDDSLYANNAFEEINGKCFDLDGFHDGAVRDNLCTNLLPPEQYPFGHFGIVMNNSDPKAHSGNIEISGNRIHGTKFGGLFLMGSGNRILNNRFLRINTAGCNQSAAKFNCIYNKDEPELLESGIYLSRGVARPEEVRDNVIEGNEILGHGMKAHCIAAGPGVSLAANRVAGNQCADYAGAQ